METPVLIYFVIIVLLLLFLAPWIRVVLLRTTDPKGSGNVKPRLKVNKYISYPASLLTSSVILSRFSTHIYDNVLQTLYDFQWVF